MRILLTAIAAAAAVLSQAGSILGIDDNGLYAIDVATGSATLRAALAGHGTGDTNALAYDASSKKAYFQRNGDLWSVDLSNALRPVFAKTGYKVGSVDDATFYKGAYYYGVGREMRKIDFTTPGYKVAKTFATSYGYGDIATTASGTLYGSSGDAVYRADLATVGNTATALAKKGHQLQLGFVGATLYGIANGNAGAATGAIYTVDLTTGLQTATKMGGASVIARYNGAALAIRDAATLQAVPEPSSVAALALGALGLLRRRRKA